MIIEAEKSRDVLIDTRKCHATVICAIGRRLSRFLSVPRPFFHIFENARKYRIFQAETVLNDGYRYERAGGSARGLRDGDAGFVPVNISEDQTS